MTQELTEQKAKLLLQRLFVVIGEFVLIAHEASSTLRDNAEEIRLTHEITRWREAHQKVSFELRDSKELQRQLKEIHDQELNAMRQRLDDVSAELRAEKQLFGRKVINNRKPKKRHK